MHRGMTHEFGEQSRCSASTWYRPSPLPVSRCLLATGFARAVPPLARFNLPAPVIGGLVVALALSISRNWGVKLIVFDDTLQKPLMSAFFTSIGFRVSLGLLRRGGGAVLVFLILSTVGAVLQNIIGVAMALLMGQPALFGVLCGSVTLTGGPATGLAFAPQFEAAGVPASEAVAIAAATIGIIAGGLIGAPIATLFVEHLHRRRATVPAEHNRNCCRGDRTYAT